MAGRWRALSTKILLSLVTVLVCFVFFEGIFRVIEALTRQPGQEAIFQSDPVLGRVHVKNATAVVREWSKPQPNRVSINSFGFRGPNPSSTDKAPGAIRVIVQGGSTTEDIFVDDGRTWPEQLQEKLNAHFQTDRIEVINMGTSGYTAGNCLKDLTMNGLKLKPDVVIAYHGVNDFRKALANLNELEAVEAFVKYDERETNFLSRLLCRSRILDRINQAYYYQGGARSRNYTLAYWHDPDSVKINTTGVEKPVLEALGELLELSASHGFKLAIGRQATLMKPDLTDDEVARMWRIFRWRCSGKPVSRESYLEARGRVVDAQKEFAERHGLPYIDTESWVPKTADYFVDDAHTIENGADKISDSFADGLVKSGIFQQWLGQKGPSATGPNGQR